MTIPEAFLIKFLGERVSNEDSIEIMTALLNANPHHNLKVRMLSDPHPLHLRKKTFKYPSFQNPESP